MTHITAKLGRYLDDLEEQSAIDHPPRQSTISERDLRFMKLLEVKELLISQPTARLRRLLAKRLVRAVTENRWELTEIGVSMLSEGGKDAE